MNWQRQSTGGVLSDIGGRTPEALVCLLPCAVTVRPSGLACLMSRVLMAMETGGHERRFDVVPALYR